MPIRFLVGAWLCAAPLLQAQTHLAVSEILRFTLEETREQIAAGMGPPAQVFSSTPTFFSWLYKTDVQDSHDPSHALVFRKSDGKLISVTRNFHTPVKVDALFPESVTRTYYWPNSQERKWQVRARVLGEDRLLLAMGVEKAGEPTTQLVIIRRSVLQTFFPWLKEQLDAEPSRTR
jgi:hypothetical protein